MRTDITSKHFELTSDINGFIEEKSLKLQRHLKHFSQELLSLKAGMERSVHKEEYTVRLLLTTPKGVLNSVNSGTDLFKTINLSFENLIRQTEKIKAKSLKDTLGRKGSK